MNIVICKPKIGFKEDMLNPSSSSSWKFGSLSFNSPTYSPTQSPMCVSSGKIFQSAHLTQIVTAEPNPKFSLRWLHYSFHLDTLLMFVILTFVYGKLAQGFNRIIMIINKTVIEKTLLKMIPGMLHQFMIMKNSKIVYCQYIHVNDVIKKFKLT